MNLTQGLHRALQQTPTATATVFGERRQDYRSLVQRVARLASGLRSLGLMPGDRIAMLALNADRYLEYYLAVWWAGGVVNPVNIRWSAKEIAFSLNDCASNLLIVDDNLLELGRQAAATAGIVRRIIYAGDGSAPADTVSFESLIADSAPMPDMRRGGLDLAGVFYTGGTTGFPKGVMLSHQSLMSSALALLSSGFLPFGGVCLHAAPMFHIADVMTIMAQLVSGGTHVVIPGFTPTGVMMAIATEKVTDVLLVPTMIQMLVDHPDCKNHDLRSLRRLIYGASPISEAVLHRAMAALPDADFVQAYGQTELSPMATLLPPADHVGPGARLRSAGRAVRTAEVRIVDAEGNDVPCGTVGEVAVRGPQMMLGYWNRPDETARAMRGGWMHTGDGAYMDEEGYIYVVDRMKDMIVSGGENVYSAEVENALAQHPAIASCAVIGIPSEKWGEAVHAIVVLKAGASATAEDIIAHCHTVIAGYKSPRSVEFREALPLSGAGKILKTVLRETYWNDQLRKVN